MRKNKKKLFLQKKDKRLHILKKWKNNFSFWKTVTIKKLQNKNQSHRLSQN